MGGQRSDQLTAKMPHHSSQVSSDLIWEIVGAQNAFLVKRAQSGGVRFSRDPMNLVNKHSRKHAGFVNEKAVGIQAAEGDKGGVTLVTKKQSTLKSQVPLPTRPPSAETRPQERPTRPLSLAPPSLDTALISVPQLLPAHLPSVSPSVPRRIPQRRRSVEQRRRRRLLRRTSKFGWT